MEAIAFSYITTGVPTVQCITPYHTDGPGLNQRNTNKRRKCRNEINSDGSKYPEGWKMRKGGPENNKNALCICMKLSKNKCNKNKAIIILNRNKIWKETIAKCNEKVPFWSVRARNYSVKTQKKNIF